MSTLCCEVGYQGTAPIIGRMPSTKCKSGNHHDSFKLHASHAERLRGAEEQVAMHR